MPVLVLTRHGQSVWNLENRFTGWEDVDLTPEGEAEARKAGHALNDLRFDVGFTSALKRARRTAEIILQTLGQSDTPLISSAALNERHYGALQGLDKAETTARYGAEQVKIWRRSYDIPPPEGESLKETAARVLAYYTAEMEPRLRQGQTVLMAAHGNSLRALIMHLEGLTPEEIVTVEVPTARPHVYRLSDTLSVLSKEIR